MPEATGVAHEPGPPGSPGPLEDDADTAYRRVHPDQWSNGRVSSAAFSRQPFSVAMASRLVGAPAGVEDADRAFCGLLDAGSFAGGPDDGAVSFGVAEASAVGFGVHREAVAGEHPAHAHVRLHERPPGNTPKSRKRALVDLSRTVRPVVSAR